MPINFFTPKALRRYITCQKKTIQPEVTNDINSYLIERESRKAKLWIFITLSLDVQLSLMINRLESWDKNN